MNERIDHAAEAHEYEKEACGAQRIGEESAEAMATLALMKATLALVEQQRIANIIALYHHDPEEQTGGSASDFAHEAWRHLTDEPLRLALGLDT